MVFTLTVDSSVPGLCRLISVFPGVSLTLRKSHGAEDLRLVMDGHDTQPPPHSGETGRLISE